jgi:hypothetical protein
LPWLQPPTPPIATDEVRALVDRTLPRGHS